MSRQQRGALVTPNPNAAPGAPVLAVAVLPPGVIASYALPDGVEADPSVLGAALASELMKPGGTIVVLSTLVTSAWAEELTRGSQADILARLMRPEVLFTIVDDGPA